MLKRWLDRLGGAGGAAAGLPSQQLAAAVLLMECARADFDSTPTELAAVREGLREHFGIDEAALDMLIGAADSETRRAVSLHEYVTRLNRELPIEQRRELIGLLWRVAWADGRIDPHEEALLRRLADLLYVSHSDLIRAKLDVQQALPT